MSDLLESLHIDAGLDLLRADGGLVVYPDANGYVPTTLADQYVRVYTHTEQTPGDGPNNLGGASATWRVWWYCHCVGQNEYAAAAIAMRVRSALLDVRPTISGRNCGLIRHDGGQPTQRDSSTGVDVYDRLVIYRLTTTA